MKTTAPGEETKPFLDDGRNASGKKDRNRKEVNKHGAPRTSARLPGPISPAVDHERVIPPPATCSCTCGGVVAMPGSDARYSKDIPRSVSR